MKIFRKRLPFTKKPVLLLCFFACMFVFASFTKEDRQKLHEFKKEFIRKLNLKSPKDSTEGLTTGSEVAAKKFSSDKQPVNNILNNPSKQEGFTGKKPAMVLPTAGNVVGSYSSREKQGVIGTFSDREQDKLADNFFTVEIPATAVINKKVYLEYDLFGLASHQSVSRSINHNIAIGGDIVIPSGQWNHQKEEISVTLIQPGINTILFTSPASGVKYKIKDLRIVYENAEQHVSVSEPVINAVRSEDNLYIKGSIGGNGLLLNNEHVTVQNREFEKTIRLNDEDLKNGFFTINTTDGFGKKYQIPSSNKAFKTLINPYVATKNIDISKDQAYQLSFEDALISIEKESTVNAASIAITHLREKDFPVTTQGIKNITPGSGAYRLHTRGGLTKSVKLTIPFDKKRLGLTSAREIKTFYFDYSQKLWKLEKSAVVDEKSNTVTIASKGDGDYISGIISVPESPQLNASAPTSMSGLKAGDPVARIQHMAPPTANQQGTAAVSYPIEIPSGRMGMQPKVAISYSSNGGNGWMGEGWDISGISSITVDTRWGTPTFDPSTETETYSLDGEMLMYEGDYLPHRHNTSNNDGTFDTTRQPRNASGVKRFYLRRSNDFIKIERYGSTPSDYRWIITLTNGTKRYYGGNESGVNTNAALTNNANKIVHWGITKELDKHQNNIKYQYDNEFYNGFTGEDSNLNGGKSIHISRIIYTGKNDANGAYSIEFSPEPLRPGATPIFRNDLLIDAKQGVKRIEPKRLLSVATYHNNTLIKTYTLDYTEGAFFKTLLNRIDTDGVSYQLDYHNDIAQSSFGKDVDAYAPDPDAFDPAVNATLTPSKIGSSNTFEWGWSLRAGAGLGLFVPHSSGDRNFMVTGFTGESYPRNKGSVELIDFNGDGVLDILYRKRSGENRIRFIPGSLNNEGDLEFDDGERDVFNLRSNFAKTNGTTWNGGGTVLINWWKMGFDYTRSWSESESETPIYLLDANSDGLPDVVKDGKVWFNKISTSGQHEMVTTSEQTENMVIKGNMPAPYTEPVDNPAAEEEEPVKGKNDVVKVWIAPKSGFIKITDNISVDNTWDPDAKAVYSIETRNPENQPKNLRLFLTILNAGTSPVPVNIEHYNSYPGTPLGINNSSRVFVNSGDKVFFRLHKKTGINHNVNSEPVVYYVDTNGTQINDSFEEEQDDFMPNGLKYQESYLLNNLIKSRRIDGGSGPGVFTQITSPKFTVPKLNDEVTYSIVATKTFISNPATDVVTVYSKTYPESATPVQIDAVNEIFGASNSEQWNVQFIVRSDSYMDKSLEWKDIKVFSDKESTAVYPSYYVKDFKKKYDLSTINNLPQGAVDYSISVNKNSGITPVKNGTFTYIIKKNGHVLGKRLVTLSNTGAVESTLTGTAIPALTPIPFYNGDPSQGVPVTERINILVYCNTYFDRVAYESFRQQLQNNIFNIYYGTNQQLLSSTTETSLSTAELTGVSATYHNWGQFIYNSNKDVKPGSNPMTPPSGPKEWDLQTGPTPSTGPDYVLNPDTPKDNYGMLINNSFIDAPWSSLNFNYSSCGGSAIPSVYGDCVGDILQANFQSLANNIIGSFTPIVPFTVYKKTDHQGKTVEKWSHSVFTEQYALPKSFRDEEYSQPIFITDTDPDQDDVEVQGNVNTAMFAISKKQKSQAKTTNWGIGIPVVSQSTSQLRGYEDINTQDFFDVNGDGYPDMLYRTQSQLTNALGGLKSAGPNLEGGGNSVISSSESFQKAHTIAFSPSAAKTVGRSITGDKTQPEADSSTPWSGGLSTTNYPDSYDKGILYWMDINGDGLADRVIRDGNQFKYKLNYGNGSVNSPLESYSGLVNYNSTPVSALGVSIGGALSGMLDVTTAYSSGWGMSGSISASSSTGTSRQAFYDVNGDGLVDLVNVGGSVTMVSYNKGNKFGYPQQILKQGISTMTAPAHLSNEVKNYNGSLSLGLGIYANVPILTLFGATILYFRAGADTAVNLGNSISEVNKAFRDVNADGFPDLVVNTGSGFTVNYSKINSTNKLAKVTEKITNGTFSIDYSMSRPTYRCPYGKLVMTNVKVFNPNVDSDTYTLSTAGKDISTSYSYQNPKYDRRERNFYGFETVTSKEMDDNTVVSTTIETFYNNTYFNNGLLRKTEVYKGDAAALASKSEKSYKQYKFINNYTQIQEIPSAEFDTYDTGGTEGRRMATILPVRKQETSYESGGSITTTDNMVYNNIAQLISFQHVSPAGSGNYAASMAYHSNALLSSKNILDIPSEIKVFDSGNQLIRQRNTLVDPNNGDVTKVRVKLNAAQTAETEISYFPEGNIHQVTYPDGYNLAYEYDALGKYVTSVTDSFGLISSAVYDPRWDAVLEATDISGNIISYTYDSRGRIESILAPKEVGVSAYTVHYSYFLSPIIIKNKTYNLYGSTTKNYDPDHPGNPIETITLSDFTGEPVQVKKDIAMLSGEKMSVSGLTLKDALGRDIKEFHPIFENKSTVLNQKFNLNVSPYFTTTAYDELDRVINTTDEDGNATTITYNIDGDLFKKTVSQMQNAITEIKSDHITDAEGRTRITRNYLSGIDVETSFSYNSVGELLRTVDPEGIITLYEYDLGGRRTDESHPDHGLTRFTYDVAGHLLTKRTANLALIEYEYELNRLKKIKYPNLPSGAPNPSNVQYLYGSVGSSGNNDSGKLITVQDGSGSTSYHYGSMGEVTQEIRNVTGYNIPAMTFFSFYEYDSWNRLKKIIYPDYEEVQYAYDLGGNLKDIKSTQYGDYVKNIQYDEYEQRVKILFGNDTYSDFEYVPTNRLLYKHILKKDSYADYLEGYYSYDNIGNVLSVASSGFSTPNHLGGTYEMFYTYDGFNRLSTSTGNFSGAIKANPVNIGDLQSSYELELGYRNSSSIAGKKQSHTVDGSVNAANTYQNTYEYEPGTHKLLSVTDGLTGNSETFQYDANGNPLTHNSTIDPYKYMYWDEEDHMKAFFSPDQAVFHYYTYDCNGDRTIKYNLANDAVLFQNGASVEPTSMIMTGYKVYPNPYVVVSSDNKYTKHYFAGDKRIASRLGDNPGLFNKTASAAKKPGDEAAVDPETDFKEYLKKAGFESSQIDTEFAKSSAQDGLYYLHGDHLGTATYVTDDTGLPTQFFLNLPFGETFAEQQILGRYQNQYKFNAKELDSETGFYYYGARYYNPRLSVWYGVDPLASDYPDVSPFVYSFDNPVKYTDPTGMAPDLAIDAEPSGCCQQAKGFALTVADNMMGSNLRNTYGADTKEYKRGVASGHIASTIAGALMMYDGGGNISAGGSAIAASALVSSSDAGAVPGSIGALAGAGLVAKGIAETAYGGAIMLRTAQNAKSDANNSKTPGKTTSKASKGRTGRQPRLRELSKDPKLGKADKGWLKSEINKVAKGKRKTIRNPPGKDLAHERGREAAKGYSYEYSHLNNTKDHKTQHKYDNGGRKNKERPVN